MSRQICTTLIYYKWLFKKKEQALLNLFAKMVSNAKNRFKKSLTRIFLDAPKLGVKWNFVREVKPLTDEQVFYDKFFYNKFTLASVRVYAQQFFMTSLFLASLYVAVCRHDTYIKCTIHRWPTYQCCQPWDFIPRSWDFFGTLGFSWDFYFKNKTLGFFLGFFRFQRK